MKEVQISGLLWLAIVVLAAALSASAAKDETIPFNQSNSSVGFTASKVVMGSSSGEFRRFAGVIHLAPGKPEASSVSVRIETGSVEADAGGLTRHLKTADFFDVEKYPFATFASTAVRGQGNGYVITGILDFHGVKRQIAFPAAIRVDPGAVVVDARFTLNRKEFGIEYDGSADNLIRDEVVIRLSIRAPRPTGH